MKATVWLGATALAAALATGSAFAGGDKAQQGAYGAQPGAAQLGAAAGAGQTMQQHDEATLREVQEQLQQMGLYEGEIDGLWGPLTESAVRQYQEREGLEPSGQLDQQTMAQLGVDDGALPGTAAGAGATPSDDARIPGLERPGAEQPGAAAGEEERQPETNGVRMPGQTN